MPSRELRLDRPVDVQGSLPGLISGDPSRSWRDGVLRLAGRLPEGSFQVAVSADGGRVQAQAWGTAAEVMLARLPELVGELDDPSGFEPAEPRLRRLHRRHPGIRFGRQGRPWDHVVPAVLGQKVTTVEAGRSLRRLVRSLGEPAPGPDGLWLLPTPDRVAATPYYDFHELGIERRRAETLQRVAGAAARLERAGTTEGLEAALIAIRGIGPWTSALVRDRALGDADAVPVGDYHLPNGVAWLLADEPRADDDRMLELLAPYAGHRGRVVRLVKVSGTKAPKYGPRTSPRDFTGM